MNVQKTSGHELWYLSRRAILHWTRARWTQSEIGYTTTSPFSIHVSLGGQVGATIKSVTIERIGRARNR